MLVESAGQYDSFGHTTVSMKKAEKEIEEEFDAIAKDSCELLLHCCCVCLCCNVFFTDNYGETGSQG